MALDALKFVIQEEVAPRTRIRVFGVGGGGSNAVARMLQEGLAGVEFCVLNTDVQALASSPAPSKLAIGSKITNGLGAGSDPSVGRQAALEDTEEPARCGCPANGPRKRPESDDEHDAG